MAQAPFDANREAETMMKHVQAGNEDAALRTEINGLTPAHRAAALKALQQMEQKRETDTAGLKAHGGNLHEVKIDFGPNGTVKDVYTLDTPLESVGNKQQEAAAKKNPVYDASGSKPGSDSGTSKPGAESADQTAARNQKAEAADNQIKANHYLQALGGVGPDGKATPEPQATDDRNKAIKEFNDLPASKRAAVTAAMHDQQLQHPTVPAVANVYNPDGTIKESHTSTELLGDLKAGQSAKFNAEYSALSPADKAAMGSAIKRENTDPNTIINQDRSGAITSVDYIARDNKNNPHTVHEYRSPEQIKQDAATSLGYLRTHNTKAFSDYYMSLPDDQRVALANEMRAQERAYENQYPQAAKMILSPAENGPLTQVDMQGPGGKFQKIWTPPKDDIFHKFGRVVSEHTGIK
jgi:hypothetical protein